MFAALCLATLAFQSPDVAMFRGDPSHSGTVSEQAPREFHHLKWTFPTGGRIFSSPVQAQGWLFFGSDDGNVYCVDPETGIQKWKAQTGGPVDSTPAIEGPNLFVMSYDGRLYCFDTATGAIRWKFFTNGERRFEAKGIHGMLPHNQTFPDPFDMYLSSPTVDGNTVYFGCGDTNLYAVDANSGELKWKFKTGDVIHGSPAISNGTAYVGSWDSWFYAVDANSGKLKWKFQGGTDEIVHNQVGFQSSPSVQNGMVYVGCRDSNLYALDASTGKEVWRSNNEGSWVNTSPAVTGDTLLYATCDSRTFRAVSARTGKDLYKQESKGYMFSSPTIAGDVVLIGGFNGILDARDLATGSLLWSYRTKGSIDNPFWALTSDGSLNISMVFNSSFAQPQTVEKEFTAGCIASTPLVYKKVVYFGSTDGYLYAID